MPKLNIQSDAAVDTIKKVAVPLKTSPVAQQDRITMVLNITHEHWGEEPFSHQTIVAQLLEDKEEPYKKRVKATEKWQPIPLGDIPPEKVGLLIFENSEGRAEVTNPTPARKAEIATKVVQVGNENDYDRALPGGVPVIRSPADITKIMFRCENGDNPSCRVIVFSK